MRRKGRKARLRDKLSTPAIVPLVQHNLATIKPRTIDYDVVGGRLERLMVRASSQGFACKRVVKRPTCKRWSSR